jgi:hypothetical protein
VVKKLLVLVVVVLMAAAVQGATVILKGGKRLQVASYFPKGNSMTVCYADGHLESYPLSAVDLPATTSANANPVVAPTAKPDTGPKSPFAGAMAQGGAAGLVVTDMDVAHVEKSGVEAAGEAEGTPGQTGPRGRIVLVNYQKVPVGDNLWDITATVANQGDAPVQPVSATIVAADSQGKSVGSASATLDQKLEPGQQGVLTGRLTVTGPIASVAFDLSWQSIVPVPTPLPGAAPGPGPSAPAPAPKAVATPAPVSPMAVVNPMDSKALTTAPPPPPQIPR